MSSFAVPGTEAVTTNSSLFWTTSSGILHVAGGRVAREVPYSDAPTRDEAIEQVVKDL